MPAKEQCFHDCPESFPSCLVVEELFILDLALTALEGTQLYASRHCEAVGDAKHILLPESCVIKCALCSDWERSLAFTNAYAQRRQLSCHKL